MTREFPAEPPTYRTSCRRGILAVLAENRLIIALFAGFLPQMGYSFSPSRCIALLKRERETREKQALMRLGV